jgi:hypothetical protein
MKEKKTEEENRPRDSPHSSLYVQCSSSSGCASVDILRLLIALLLWWCSSCCDLGLYWRALHSGDVLPGSAVPSGDSSSLICALEARRIGRRTKMPLPCGLKLPEECDPPSDLRVERGDKAVPLPPCSGPSLPPRS